MIRTDKPAQWADTMIAMSDDHWPPHRPFIPQGCDQQGRLTPTIEPAHAASEYEEPDTHEDSGGAIVWPLLIAVVASVAAGVHLAAWMGWL